MKFNNEKEVEYFYWSALEKIGRQMDKGFTMTAANKTDGYFSAGNIKAICEIKYGFDFSSSADVARVIIQSLYYIKSRQKRGLESPSSIFVGDDDQYFIVSVKQFADILDGSYNNEMDPNWEISPSSAYRQNAKLFQELFVRQIPLMIKKLDESFDQEFVRNRLIALASNENIKTKLNADSIKKPFHYFTQSVLVGGESLKDHVKIKLFFAVITGSEEAIYLRGKIKFEGRDYQVHDGYYAGFVNIYQTKYKTSERENFVASMDSLIKEEARRFHGAYFTPKIIVDHAHSVLTETLGDNWKEEYVVWDPAAGTLNLTRDYQFKELYCSTLFQEELDLASDYNPEAKKFQFDFLNDEFKPERNGGKIPNGLFDSVRKGRKFLILMNPPYANSGSGQKSNVEKNANKTVATEDESLREGMQKEGFGLAARDLTTKFFYRMTELLNGENFKFASFNKTTLFRLKSTAGVKRYLCKNYKPLVNFAFDSAMFEGASGGWPVMFNIWEKGTSDYREDFTLNFVKADETGKMVEDRKHSFPYIEENIVDWIKEPIENEELVGDILCLSMPTTLKTMDGHRKLKNNNLGDVAVKPTISAYSGDRGIYTASYSNKPTHSYISTLNFDRVNVYNAARSLIKPNLYNESDDFVKPNESHEKFEEFRNDSIVLNLFEKQSYQSSLRKVGYDASGNPINYPTPFQKGSINIYNEWFFLPQKEIADLADEHFSELYQDTKGQKDRHVYLELEKLIAANKLSAEAIAVLEAGRKLFRDTFPIREKLHSQFPEYHLNAWDAGYWQLRTALERAGLDSYLADIRAKYKVLEDKMRPLVYELGFLRGQQ